ncbi:MAG: DNA polymerase III subunit alpha [Muricauda sp.]|nr:DNA polymerase III subunit alpha [Allomuricauda sp.]MBO6532316.1 DNA polymerase III subunit alpha [Allomuricauda sp.]MBO6590590.1 DNA polymerase III subunit alpha [Allomuricauda sp.]MBO6620216.1 DNA polymerase III subunit alpha [Allomuricauda sp.]MBO6646093.1 DNA polymerase III subunit alpha [Allomuricauda sp.]MBO6748554.1 DNA polymerase III subunit alpha [Allomuricauda sp.]
MYLNCHTYYSLRFGTFSEVELLQLAKQNHVTQLVLTDINNTSAGLNFVRKAPEFGIKPILGIDFRNGVLPCFIGIAKNNEGYLELNDFLSQHLHDGSKIPDRAPAFKNAFVVYPFEQVLLNELDNFQEHEFVGISIKDLRRLPFSKLASLTHKLVVQQPVTFRNKQDFNAHRLLRAIDNNILLSKLPKEEEASEEEKMYPIQNLAAAFSEFPFILENTEKLLNKCSIHFDFSKDRKPQNLKTYLGSVEEDEQLLDQLCAEGLPYRYEEVNDSIKNRLNKELELIKKMGFVSYFLINWEIVSEARRRGFFYVGRGSGANSIVAYLLRITDVDPMELDLYFERFINLYRANPPDFDIDFSWKDRPAMTEYIFERFEHVALLGTYVTFKERGVIRELGKVFGLPPQDIDFLLAGRYDFDQLDHVSKLVLKYGSLLKGKPNYLSIHAGGILISDKPLHWFSATHLPPKGFPTTQYDMVIAEDVGLYKFDILGQRGLGKIKEALEIVAYNQPEKYGDIDIHDIKGFKKDPVINNLIKTAQCMGCFYVESPAMRMLLKKLQVDTYLGLVAASSIIRPGVAKSGMMREYILRHRNKGRTEEKAHPVMLEIMPDTYGVMVYQEDVIKVAHHFAGLDLGEADVLRRGMSGKFRSREEFQKVQDKFISNCRKKGYAESLISEIWNQVASFAGYAFAKGHSASYAVESYQSLFLRAYFPLEYMVAVLNNGGGFYRSEFYVHDARMMGATIHPPCVNKSMIVNRIYGKHIYLGMMYLRDLESRVMERILKERMLHGSFSSLEDFLDRVFIRMEQLSILIRIDAFRFTGINKHELLWKAHLMLSKNDRLEHPKLFPPRHQKFQMPQLNTTTLETAFEQWELLGFCLCSPFELLEEPPKNSNGQKDLERYLNKYIDIYGYLVTVKNTSTHHGKRMHFATLVDQHGEVFDTVLFPPVAAKYYFRGKGIYRFYGKVVEEFGFLSIEVIKMKKENYVQDPRYADMRMSKKLFDSKK